MDSCRKGVQFVQPLTLREEEWDSGIRIPTSSLIEVLPFSLPYGTILPKLLKGEGKEKIPCFLARQTPSLLLIQFCRLDMYNIILFIILLE